MTTMLWIGFYDIRQGKLVKALLGGGEVPSLGNALLVLPVL